MLDFVPSPLTSDAVKRLTSSLLVAATTRSAFAAPASIIVSAVAQLPHNVRTSSDSSIIDNLSGWQSISVTLCFALASTSAL